MCKGTDWIRKASLKGVAAQEKIRAEKYNMVSRHLSDLMKDGKTYEILARLAGFIMGDGCMEIRKDKKKDWHHHEIRFYPDSKEVGLLFIESFKYLYMKEPTIKERINYYCVRVTSKFACLDLLKYGRYSKLDWDAPQKLLINAVAKIEFIRALFDCESHVSKRNVCFQSVNEKGTRDLHTLLSELGIESRLYKYKRSNPKWNINHLLMINKKESIKRYAQIIGFNHPAKQKAVCKLAGVPERLMGESRKLVSERAPRFES